MQLKGKYWIWHKKTKELVLASWLFRALIQLQPDSISVR